MIREICKDEAFLAQKAETATPDDLATAADLLDTLVYHKAGCVGMAANMIGFPVSIIAVSLGPVNVAMLNPRLVKKAHPYQTKEGCLSLTGTRSTTRFERITVAYQDLTGAQQELELTGLAAQAVQHECDHLRGILI